MSQTYIWFDLAGGWTDPETGETFRPGQTVRFDTSVTETAELVQRAIDAGAAVDLPQLLATFFPIAWSNITGKPASFTPSAHTHTAADVVSGEFSDDRISQSSVTQHQVALALAIAQITGLQAALDAKLATSLKGAANGLAELDASSLLKAAQLPNVPASKVTGTLDTARIPQLDWSKIIEATRPTTLAGYGIADALTSTEIGQQIQAAIDALVGGAPGALDTLNELAAALGDDPDAIATLTNAVSSKLDASVWQAASDTVDGYMSKEDKAKLDGIETGATADQTGAEIKAAYEGEADTNAYTDAEKSKLAGIAEEATANQTDTYLRSRANHTGTQAISTVAGLQGALDDKADIAALPRASVAQYSSTDTVTDLAGSGGAVIGWDEIVQADSAISVSGGSLTFNEAGQYKVSARIEYEDTSTEGVDVDSSIGVFFKLNGVAMGGKSVGTAIRNVAGANEGSAYIQGIANVEVDDVLTICTQRESGADELTLRSGESALIIEKVGGKSALLPATTIGEVQGLQAALDSKAAATHDIIDIAPSSSVITPATGVQAFEANSALEAGWPAPYTVGLNVKFSENRLFQLTASNTAMWFRNGHNVNGSGGTGPGWYPWRLIWNSANFDPTTKADKSNTYTQAEVDAAITAAIDALIGGAPGALDTLNELAAALDDDEAFAATITASLGSKIDVSAKGAANGVATLDGDGKLNPDQIPDGIGGAGLTVATIKTSAFTPAVGEITPVDTSGGGVALTALPETSTYGARFALEAHDETWSPSNPVTLPALAGAPLNGEDVDLIFNEPGVVFARWTGETYGWEIVFVPAAVSSDYRAATVETPSITSPADDATDVGETIIVTASAFAMTYQSDTHASTDWQRSTASDFSTIDAESLEDASNLTSWTTPAHGATSTGYFYRVRYRSAGGVVSEWSPVISVTTASTFIIVEATGGTVTDDGDYRVHTFTTSDTFEVQSFSAGNAEFDLLVVGGGGAGGVGGGGAGGVRHFEDLSVPAVGSHSITVGAGGLASGSYGSPGSNGGASSALGYSASGGGRGGHGGASSAGQSGGSGGGGAASNIATTAGGAGNSGGYSPVEGYGGGSGATEYAGGGGGGAGQAGSTGSGSVGGDGGDGISVSITGTATYYGGGGSGASDGGTPIPGGLGGGGQGGSTGLSADANTGGGGGGANSTGTNGGSGVVIIRYRRVP